MKAAVRQARNRDPALFPLLDPGGLNLAPFLQPVSRAQGRSQVVEVQGAENVDVIPEGNGRFTVQIRFVDPDPAPPNLPPQKKP